MKTRTNMITKTNMKTETMAACTSERMEEAIMKEAIMKEAFIEEAITEEPICEVPIRDRLRRRLLALNYHAFAGCLCLLLTRLGYEEAQVAGRTRWKGRNCEGGYDIKAALPTGIGRCRIIVQVKQFDALPVFQRSVDELRGTCLRAGAAEALMITTSTFSPVVLRNEKVNARSASAQVAPVRLLDGEELLGLLILHRIGVWEKAGSSPFHSFPSGPTTSQSCRLGLDNAFFDELSRKYAGNSQAGNNTRTGKTQRHNPQSQNPQRRITVPPNRRLLVPPPVCDGQRPSWLLTIWLDLRGSVGNGPSKEPSIKELYQELSIGPCDGSSQEKAAK